MPKPGKANEREPAVRREGAKRTTAGPPVKGLSESYADIFEGWTSFYRDMGSRLTENLTKQQKAYEELFGKWTQFAGSTWKIVENMSTDERQRELYDVWRNYINKLGSRMARANTEGLKGYGEVASSFEQYASRIAENVQKAASGKFDTIKAEEVYDSWLEIAGKLRQQMDKAAELTKEELEDLSRTWMDFSGKVESLASEQLEKGGSYEQLIDLWAKQSKDVAEALAGFIKGHDHEYEEIRKTWTDHFVKMQENMVELAKAIGVSYEEMYRRFLEGGVTSLSDLPLFPLWRSTTESEEVKSLKRRVENLEKGTEKSG